MIFKTVANDFLNNYTLFMPEMNTLQHIQCQRHTNTNKIKQEYWLRL